MLCYFPWEQHGRCHITLRKRVRLVVAPHVIVNFTFSIFPFTSICFLITHTRTPVTLLEAQAMSPVHDEPTLFDHLSLVKHVVFRKIYCPPPRSKT